ncbi:MAG TPA: DNA glycosylase [Clostridia bacterium]|nr:DNA glycosylase [Clostridia bacterium]
MKIQEDKNKGILRIEGLSNFNPRHIFECGQAFRWNWDGEGYVGVASGRVLRMLWDGATLTLENTTLKDFNAIWRDYFDLDTDYGEIIKELSKDSILQEAIKHGWGIRILNQDPWETLISFIISARNGIDRIKTTVEKLSQRFGIRIPQEGGDHYRFPDVDALADADESELRGCGCGYRGRYIKGTARMIRDGEINLGALKTMDYENAKEQLLKCPGVGPKVADCILLFSLRKGQAFPVDVWIGRIMEELYSRDMVDFKDIRGFADNRFGNLAGYAQQYLFYYAREKQIGKK